ncbi:MAG: YjbH domain-containing protein [Marinibacterium sp.]|nr:YjbH domain-containing protein [Marinibacterium sp.]
MAVKVSVLPSASTSTLENGRKTNKDCLKPNPLGKCLLILYNNAAWQFGAGLALLAGLATGAQAAEPDFKRLPPTSLNLYGSVGLIDMPTAKMTYDGNLSMAVGYFGGQLRTTMTFQALPWLSASFRYNGTKDLYLSSYSTLWDRNFDVRVRLLKETHYMPSLTVGLQDFAGTGLNAAEYIVATKTLQTLSLGSARPLGKLQVSAGLGWGRLGSQGPIGSPFGSSRPTGTHGRGGQLSYDQWFRGPMAPFGGIEWQLNEKLGVKLEYSSDAYVIETQRSNVFEQKSSFNFGVEYQVTNRARLGAYYLYGSEFGLTAQIQLSPYYPATPLGVPAPNPIQQRPDRNANPELWDTAWAQSAQVPAALRDILDPILRADGLVLETLDVAAYDAELRYRNLRYRSHMNAVGRAARAMALTMPASVETFRLIEVNNGMAIYAVTLRRSDLEALEYAPRAAEAIDAVLGYSDPSPVSETAVEADGLYPGFSWSLAPYFSQSYFDPDTPFRLDVGAELRGTYRPAPGWIASGGIRQRIWGNIADSYRVSNSRLPPVRTNAVRYAKYETTLTNLFAAYQWKPGRDLYGRVTLGYLEPMFGGISTELLWKPVNSRLGLGVEANWVFQRDFNQQFTFQNYNVITGHASAYYKFNNGFFGRVDVGRYLAGDVGATFTLDREFNNGFLVGGFFTLTDVNAAKFGEGSFDKGIRVRIPVTWFLGKPSRQAIGTTVRPIQRDGGAKLSVPGRLYPQVRDAHRKALQDQRARFWN